MQEFSINDLQELFTSGDMTSEQLVKQFLARIETIDKLTNAIIELNPDAISIAQQMDQERANGELRGALHGIPVILKDNIDTADNMMTTAGSLALKGNYAQEDAFIVKKLREAGAIILAKSNLSEWANFRGQRSSSGWSSRGRQTNNPYALDRNPCGSSSGSAVAVAANLCTVAIGTETDGSVICPSNANGIVGIKPSIGLCSRSGVIPISHTQDTVGPMTRTVEDAAIVLGALVGHDEKDPVTEKAHKGEADYTVFLEKDGLKGARLGYTKKIMTGPPKIKRLFEHIIDQLKTLGAEVIEFEELPTVEGLGPAEYTVLLYEYKDGLTKYLSKLSSDVKVHSMEEVIAFNDEHKEQVLPHFGHEHFTASVEKGNLDSEEYVKAMKLYEEYKEKIAAFMDENKLDALINPSGGPAWLTDHINGDSFTGVSSMTSIAAITGFSSITVPAGYITGLPVGLSFIGRQFAEPTLIKFAYSFEQHTHARKPPMFKPTIETE